jgi:hypothetical protein
MISIEETFKEMIEYTKIASNMATDINNGDNSIHKKMAYKHTVNILNMLTQLRDEAILLDKEMTLLNQDE